MQDDQPSGVTRRRVLQGSALGAAIWATPAITTVGSRAWAAGSVVVRRARITLSLTAYPGVYDHADDVSLSADGSFTGSGTHDSGNGAESVSGSYAGASLTYTAVYDGGGYSFFVPPSAVAADGSFQTTITDNGGGQYAATGTFNLL